MESKWLVHKPEHHGSRRRCWFLLSLACVAIAASTAKGGGAYGSGGGPGTGDVGGGIYVPPKQNHRP